MTEHEETAVTTHIELQQIGELPCWHIRHQGAQLLVAEQGAQILAYQRDDAQPLIWLSEQVEYRKGQGLRGGVPVCWPWFGALERNPGEVQAMRRSDQSAPAHGLVRTLDWQLKDIGAQGDAVIAEFCFDTREQPLPDWPHAIALTLRIRLDQRLHLELTSHNHGPLPVFISQALHTYFAVSDIHQVQVEGLHGCRYIETLHNWENRLQHGPLQFSGETDRIYLDVPSQLGIRDPQWQRRIHLQSSGSQSAVVWNPWIEKSRHLSQFDANAWPGMLCIETANVLEDRLELAPGGQHSLTLTLWESCLDV
jgi:glucose-6-phosphate 1-epimerase